MEVRLLDIVAGKTNDPRQLADIEEIRECALAVAEVEQSQAAESQRHQLNCAALDEISAEDDAKDKVFVIQSRFCQRAGTASEAVESIVEYERDELDFLHLLRDLATPNEQIRMQPLIRRKEQLVIGMELFVSSWK